ALIRGLRPTAQATALATMSSGETLTYSPRNFVDLSRRTIAIVSVTSTSRNSVTCGIVNAESTMAYAISFAPPWDGRRSASSPRPRAEAAAVAVAPDVGADTWSAAPRTSSRVTSPWGPVATTWERSTPRSFASLRTGGFANGLAAPAGTAAGSAGPG